MISARQSSPHRVAAARSPAHRAHLGHFAHIALGAAAALVLTLVFFAYLQPEFALELANQIWNCF